MWCESKFREKIILWGHDVPHGDEHHQQVYGSPGNADYDGLHLKGPYGKAFITSSIQKLLIKTKFIHSNSELYVPQGWNAHQTGKQENKNNQQNFDSTQVGKSDVPKGRKPSVRYNPMGIMIDRIRSISSVNQLHGRYSATNNESDEVFNQPSGSNPFSPSLKKQIQGQRPSVIQPSYKNENLSKTR